MTETLLALVPDYGLLIIFTAVFIGSFGVPAPTSMLVLAAGGFAATGDLSIWGVLGTTLLAFLVGDQLAFSLGQKAGPTILGWLNTFQSMSRLVERAKALLDARGGLAVFLGHTVISPTCAYVTYLSGMGGVSRRAFSLGAIPGATAWTGLYTGIGYGFASRLSELSSLVGNMLGMVGASVALVLSAVWLRKRWRVAKAQIA